MFNIYRQNVASLEKEFVKTLDTEQYAREFCDILNTNLILVNYIYEEVN